MALPTWRSARRGLLIERSPVLESIFTSDLGERRSAFPAPHYILSAEEASVS